MNSPDSKQALAQACRAYLAETHTTWDAPSIDVLTRAASRKESQIEWAAAYLQQVAPKESDQHLIQRWTTFTRELIEATGTVTGRNPPIELPTPPSGYSSALPFGEAKRDSRFKVQLQGFERPSSTRPTKITSSSMT
jgi:hypothetical protein